ncbi:copper homeostasis protein CutC [Hanstruepera neustonica]|uniref:PF03932 family protein CutC n=1 Tax=Hanstruepera neustonica TaxID=1445657 RepID=A0A2K1E175_9FLAO|nr:copper homeostasis protein CutC [Hanstruepera neustonica]PNQ74042.1 copper homeostasis protein CutC [Hanstruepera neustonica]
MLLEICANSYQSAISAQEAGAHRIELCSELSVGGITPSYGLIKQVVAALSIPVYVLIRPRSGNFCYSSAEFEIMKQDIEVCKALGVQGIVSGVLKEDNTIDIKRTQELIKWADPLPFTYHRAFDCVPNPEQALEALINLGVNRILTSGQQSKAINGMQLLSDLKEQAKNNITILVGSGINPENAADFKKAGFEEIHASASKIMSNAASEYFGNTPQTVSDIKIIRDILNAIQ